MNCVLPIINNHLIGKIQTIFKYINLSKFIKYRQIIIKLLKRIDDRFILEQKNVGNDIKIYALSKKHEKDMRKYIKFNNGKLKYKEYNILNLHKNKEILKIKLADINDNIFHIEAIDNCWMQKERYYYYCTINYKKYFPYYKVNNAISLKTMFGITIEKRIIYFDIPLDNILLNHDFRFYFTYMNHSIEIFPILGYFSHVPPIKNSYYINGNYILIYNGKRITLKQNFKGLSDKLEKKYCHELKKKKKRKLIQIRKEAIQYFKKPKKKDIWLINDRYNKAGDNGEFFFRYLKHKNPKNIDFNFVISQKSPDYQRMKCLGNILLLGTKKYKRTFLKADKIISSSSAPWAINPFGKNRKYLIDLYHFDFIFLQHGITKDDVSDILNKLTKNFSIIVTASKYEYNSFLSNEYGYSTKNIKLTGFSRFDNFRISENKNYYEKTILLS